MRSRANIKSHPIHPMLVAFPVGLWITALIFALIAISGGNTLLWSASFFAIIAGCVGAALAAIPGAIDLFTVVPPNSSGRKRGLIHASLNVIALLLFIYIAWRQGGPTAADGLTVGLEVVGVVLIGISGWLGGTLAYRNQIGVDHRYANAGKFRERTVESFDRPVCNQSELGDGQMMLIHVGSERIAVGRCPEGVFAISDHCTHRGGPLSDGAMIDCTVQCPWHGSQFDVRTGRVVAGPAEIPIETYQVTIRAGEVYLQPNRRLERQEPEPKAA